MLGGGSGGTLSCCYLGIGGALIRVQEKDPQCLFFFSPLDLSEPELVSLFFYSQTDTTDKINLSLQNSSYCLLIIDQLDETKLPMFSDFVDERP
jgi:hypothetical protein